MKKLIKDLINQYETDIVKLKVEENLLTSMGYSLQKSAIISLIEQKTSIINDLNEIL